MYGLVCFSLVLYRCDHTECLTTLCLWWGRTALIVHIHNAFPFQKERLMSVYSMSVFEPLPCPGAKLDARNQPPGHPGVTTVNYLPVLKIPSS